MKHDAKIEVIEKVNKKGEVYQMLQLYVKDVMIHEIYMKDSLQQILNYMLRSDEGSGGEKGQSKENK